MRTFEEFWPYYLRAHSKPTTRAIHVFGTLAAGAALLAYAATGKAQYIALALASSYGPAWLSHFHIERNTPATFGHPLWSIRADVLMTCKWLAGTLDAELARHGISQDKKAVP
jgi:hypothetical protein